MNSIKSSKALTKGAATNYVKVCRRIRELRIREGETQPEFAAKIKTTRVNLNQIERGGHAPTIIILQAIKRKYNVTYDWLLDGK